MNLDPKNQEQLLDIAESAIMNRLERSEEKHVDTEYLDEEITVNAGAFVSVYIGKKLRGCIGTFSESEALFENVRKMAVSAAFTDSRFMPVQTIEADHLHIEISVLTPRKRIYSEDEIEIGKHGIYIISGSSRGTLLPQVAVKNSWSALEFLEFCAEHKVGIHKHAWRQAELYTYEAIVFRR